MSPGVLTAASQIPRLIASGKAHSLWSAQPPAPCTDGGFTGAQAVEVSCSPRDRATLRWRTHLWWNSYRRQKQPTKIFQNRHVRSSKQAYETLHAPDAAAVMAGSAVDGMLKALGYTEGSLYSRIDKAVE